MFMTSGVLQEPMSHMPDTCSESVKTHSAVRITKTSAGNLNGRGRAGSSFLDFCFSC